jgi:hypothetical protein
LIFIVCFLHGSIWCPDLLSRVMVPTSRRFFMTQTEKFT